MLVLRQSASVVPMLWWGKALILKHCGMFLRTDVIFLVLALFSIVRVGLAIRAARCTAEKMPERDQLADTCTSLARKAGILCLAGGDDELATELEKLGALRSTSAPVLAAALEDFEAQVRVQRLSPHFLSERSKWLTELRRGRGSFKAILPCAIRLERAVQAPPHITMVIARVRQSSRAAQRVGEPVWAMIVEAIGGAHPLEDLLCSVVQKYSVGRPASQFEWAWRTVKWCIEGKSQYNLRRDTTSGENGDAAEYLRRRIAQSPDESCGAESECW